MQKIVKWDPFQDLDDLHKAFFGAGRNISSVPVSDVYVEDDRQMVVEAHLPNFDEDEVVVQINEGLLEIRAEHSETKEDVKKNRKYIVKESSSNFYRSISLPANVDENNIDADFKDGLLKIRVPFTPKPEPKKVQIKGKSAK